MRALFLALFAVFACSHPSAAAAANAGGDPPRPAREGAWRVGGPADAAKASRDTVLLMGPAGSGAAYVGNFQDAAGTPAWNGWTSVDHTVPAPSHWHASTDGAVSGSWSAWCGDPALPSCEAGDPAGGYGNNWDETLEWRGQVADPGLGCTVQVDALVSHDTEPAYDYCYLSLEKAGQEPVDLWTADGAGTAVPVSVSGTYAPADYVGADADEVAVLWRFTSDGGWSDEDCLYPTAGALRVDDVVIALDNGTGAAHDFEDGTLGPFAAQDPVGVGDFAKIWTGLEDVDPCRTNFSPQVAFIDDGEVVPGTGGSMCLTWCYGPMGYVVNTTGGLVGEGAHLHNSVVSPAMAWPDAGMNGAIFTADVYRHEDLGPGSAGIFYQWDVRSSADPLPVGLDAEPWQDRSFVYYGGPDYVRLGGDVSDLMVPGRAWVQVKLSVYQAGWIWGWNGHDATPAPYFDNARFTVFDRVGPSVTAREIELAEDGFPASGQIDLQDLGTNSVRFDMARSIAPPDHQHLDPGDSVVFEARSLEAGEQLTGPPRLHYLLQANPMFDAYRTAGLPNAGWVEAVPSRNAGGTIIEGRWAVDLPDTGFLFPGDVLHYYLSATDGTGTTLAPADTSHFGSFDPYAPYGYDPAFTVRALPSLQDYGGGFVEQPTVLFWNDAGPGHDADLWWRMFGTLGAVIGYHYDVYATNAPASGVSNGLGAAATVAQLGGYTEIVYTSGDLFSYTLANGDFTQPDASPDLQLLEGWLELGGRDLLLSGDNLASSLAGTVGPAFRSTWMGVDVLGADLRPYVDNQRSPRVLAVPGNFVFTSASSWYAYGGCPDLRTFDAVTARPGAVRAAEFGDPLGRPGIYDYSACTLHEVAGATARVVSLPYDLAAVRTDPDEAAKANAQTAARTRILTDVMAYFGQSWTSGYADVPAGAAPLAVVQEPNPFNPRTVIRWSRAQAGPLQLKVFDLRGRLVRVLHDGPAPAAGSTAWDGRDEAGAAVASGVYFYQAVGGGERAVGKMTLLR